MSPAGKELYPLRYIPEPKLTASVDDVVSAVDVQRLAGNQFGAVHREEGHGDAYVVDRNEAPRRRLRLGLLQEFVEVAQSRGSACFSGPGDIACTLIPFGPSSAAI